MEEADSVGWDTMNARFGWPEAGRARRSGTYRSSDARSELAEDPAALSTLLACVGPRDLDLYAYAKELSHRISAKEGVFN